MDGRQGRPPQTKRVNALPQTKSSILIDAGGFYYVKNPGFQVLFAYGDSVAGQPENYAYLGLYWTGGPKPGKGLNGFLAHSLSSI